MYIFILRLCILITIWILQVKSLHYPKGYIGCYKDDKMNLLSYLRVLHTKLEYPNLNCAAKCKEECKKIGFRYAGTESGEECFCGNEINQNPDKLPDTECNVPCPGQKDENCGGHWLISIYDTFKTTEDPSGPATVTRDDFDQATARFPVSPAVTVSPTQAEGTQGLTTPTTATDEKPTEASDPTTTQFIPSSADTVSTQGLTTSTTDTDEIPTEASDPTTTQIIASSADTVSTQGLTTPTTATDEIPTEASDPTTTQIISSTVDTVSSTQAVRTKLLTKHTTATDGIKSEVSDPTTQQLISTADTVSTKTVRIRNLTTPTTATDEIQSEVSDPTTSQLIPSTANTVSTKDKRIQNLTTPTTAINEILKEVPGQTTPQFTHSTASTVSSSYTAGNKKSGTRKKSFPVIYVLIPVGAIATVVVISVVVLMKRRRKSVHLLPDVRYHAACSTRETYEDDTEACQFLKNMSKHNATNLSA